MTETYANLILMMFCYLYILVAILVSNKISGLLSISRKASRKFLHVMIGNLTLIIPFFTLTYCPVLVAAPFIQITFLASPCSPFKRLSRVLKRLEDITEVGHPLGLVFYSVSFTCLTVFFGSQPLVIAAGILPTAYGDSAAAIVGEHYGRNK